jgi:hypothetical protein
LTSFEYLNIFIYRVLDPKTPEKTSPKSLRRAPPAKSSKSVAIAEDPSSSEDKSESETEEETDEKEEVLVRSSKRKQTFANTPTTTKTPAKQSSAKKSVVAQKISQRVQTPARPVAAKVETKKTPVSKNTPSKSSKALVKEFWSSRDPEVIPSRTRRKTAPSKRQSTSDETEQEKEVPSKKTRVSIRTPVAKKPIPAAKKPAKETAAPASRKTARQRRPSISPPPPRNTPRIKKELEERVCETCQQVFYSGTELALHELRHTGKELRIRLDKYEIPEPVQTLERSYLFQDPVNLEGPARADMSGGPHEFSFGPPKIVDETVNSLLAEQEALPDAPDIFQSTNDNSNSATENAVDSIIESLQDDAMGEDAKNEQEATKEKEKSAPLTVSSALSFDFFPPSSPKESSKPATSASLSFDFFEAPDPPGMKTPPPSSAAITSLSFDYFGSVDSSPSKDCSMFSPPPVDPLLALKPNSDNPVMPLPSDSDNSMTLTPPKDGSKYDAAAREAIGDV